MLRVWVFAVTVALTIVPPVVTAVGAQDTATSRDVPVPVTGMTPLALAGAVDMLTDSVHGFHLVLGGHLVMRRDSVVAAVDSMARAWVVALQRDGHQPHRIELFSMAILHVHAGQDAEARRRIAEWLAMPGLSATDRAWILANSVALFLDWQNLHDPPPSPAHIAIAREYLAQLEAQPPATSVGFLFGALTNFMETYMSLGATDTAVQYGRRAFALPAHTTDYRARLEMATSSELFSFALALSAFPDRYQYTVDSVITMLRGYVMAPVPANDAQRPGFLQFVNDTRHFFEDGVKLLRTIGQPAVPLIATHWFNQVPPPTLSDSAPGARLKRQDDGIIRVIGFGFFECPWCQIAMHDFESFQHKLPAGAECLFYERSGGAWGNDLVEPAEEAEHLRHYYIERKHYTYPIAVWAGAKEMNEDGGRVPHFSPTMRQYGFFGGPYFVIIDGHGILRYKAGGWSERRILRVVNQLVTERHHQTASPSSSAASSAPSASH
jgi:hypothetical protein